MPSVENDDLLVFGYECRYFRDDEKARWIEQKQHLVPWSGDKSLIIDRFDIRAFLTDQAEFDADLLRLSNKHGPLTEEDLKIESICDTERYLALNKKLEEEKLKEDEEWNRYQEALQEGGYSAVGYNYENQLYDPTQPTDEDYGVEPKPEPAQLIEEEKPFIAPEGLFIQKDLRQPETMKQHLVIEKTAGFVATHGGQMEVMLKAKQANSEGFNFLNIDDELHPYYKHVVKMIKERRYVPKGATETVPVKAARRARVIDHGEEVSDDSSDEGEGYLHPLLRVPVTSKPKPKEQKAEEGLQPPTNNKPALVFDPPLEKPPEMVKEEQAKSEKEQIDAYCKSQAYTRAYYEGYSIIPPPPDVQILVDRTAVDIAKNGSFREEEISASYSQDKRYFFLMPLNPHHGYFRYQKYYSEERLRWTGYADPLEEKLAALAALDKKKPPENESSSNVVKFNLSNKKKDSSQVTSIENGSALPQESSSDGEEAAEHLLEDEEQRKTPVVKATVAPDPDMFKSTFKSENEIKKLDSDRAAKATCDDLFDFDPDGFITEYEKKLKIERRKRALLFMQKVNTESKDSTSTSTTTVTASSTSKNEPQATSKKPSEPKSSAAASEAIFTDESSLPKKRVSSPSSSSSSSDSSDSTTPSPVRQRSSHANRKRHRPTSSRRKHRRKRSSSRHGVPKNYSYSRHRDRKRKKDHSSSRKHKHRSHHKSRKYSSDTS